MELSELGIVFATEGADAAIAKLDEFKAISVEVVQTDEERVKAAGKVASATEALSAQITRSIISYKGAQSAQYEFAAIAMGANEQLSRQLELLRTLEEMDKLSISTAKELSQEYRNEQGALLDLAKDIEHLNKVRAKEAADAEAARKAELASREAYYNKIISDAKAAEQAVTDARHKSIVDQQDARAKAIALYTKDEQEWVKATEKAEAQITASTKKASDDAAKIAEQKAMAEISWARKSREEQLRIKDEIAAYKSAGVSDKTISNMVGPGAMSGTVKEVSSLAEKWDHVTLNTSRARSEMVVLAHEAVQGRFSRIPASMMVFAEYTDISALAMSGLGIAVMAAVAALVAISVVMIKGMFEQKAMQDALIMTGNYAGTTADGLNNMAHAAVKAGGSIGTAKEVVTQLAASGKYTGEQIGIITNAVVLAEHATGASTDKMIKDFESLAVQSTGSTSRASEAISRAVLKLDDQYHFLTTTIFEQISALEKEGDQKAASALATEKFAEVVKQRSAESLANLGTIEHAWHGIKWAIGGAVDAVANWGKKSTAATEVARLTAKVADASPTQDVDGNVTPYAPGTAGARKLAAATMELEAAQEALNKVNNKALEDGKKAMVMSEGSHAASMIRTEDARLQKKSVGELTTAVLEYEDRVAKLKLANPDSPLVADEEVNKHLAAIVKEHTAHVAKGKAVSDANGRIAASMEKVNEAALQSLQIDDKLSKSDKFRIGTISEISEELRKKKITLGQSVDLLVRMDEIEGNMKSVEAQEAKRKALEETEKEYQKLWDTTTKQGDAALKSADAQLAKQKEHNAEIGKTKEQIELARNAQENARTETLAAQAEAYQLALDNTSLSDAAIAKDRELWSLKLSYLRNEIAVRKQIAELLIEGAAKESAAAAEKAWQASSKKIGDGLYEAISNGGDSAIKKLIKDAKEWFARLVLSPIIQPVSNFGASLLNPTAAMAGEGGGGVNAMTSLSAVQTLKSAYDTYTGGLSAYYASAANTSYGSALGLSTAPSGGLAGATAGELAYTNAIANGSTVAQANTAAIQANTASLTTTGSTLGTAMGLTASALAGISIGSAIAGDKSFMGMNGTQSSTIGVVLGAIGSYFGGPWGHAAGMLVGGVIGGVVNAAFGHGATEVREQGTRGTFSGSGFSGNNYANMHQDGGWFTSDKNWTQNSAIDGSTLKAWGDAFTGVKSAVASTAVSLGLSTDLIASYSKSIDMAAGSSKETIMALFTGMADEMALRVAPGLGAMIKEGETASVTLGRLSTTLNTANAWMSILGDSLFQTSLAGADAASKLADMFGGMDKLTAAQKSFYETYYSENERAIRSQQDMAKALALVNIALPDSKDAFKDVVNSLDKTTEAGRTAYAVMLTLGPEFAATTDAMGRMAEATAKTLADTSKAISDAAKVAADAAISAADAAISAAKASAEARTTWLQGLSDAAISGVDSVLSSITASVDAQKNAIAEAYDTQANAINDSLSTVGASIGKLQSLSNSLKSALDGMRISGSDSAYRADAQAQIRAALATARSGGGLPLDGQLTSALATVAKPSQQLYGNFVDYARDFYRTANDVAALSDLTGAQLTADEVTQSLLTAQNTTLKAGFDAEIKRLDAMVRAAQAQADAVTKSTTAITSLADALARFTSTLGATLTNSLATAFDKYDANQSGGVAWDEFKASFGSLASEATLKSLFAVTDADGNGQISLLEAISANTKNMLAVMSISGSGGALAGAGTYSGTAVASAIDATAKTGASTAQIVNAASANFGVTSLDLAKVAAVSGNAGITAYQKAVDAASVMSPEGRAEFLAQAAMQAAQKGISTERAIYDFAISHGINAATADKMLGWGNGTSNAWAAANGLPAFEQGINRVPYDMTARIHADEAVIPAAFNPFNPNARQSGASNDELVSELRAVRAELAEIKANTRATAGHTAATDRKLTRVIPGNALITEAVA